MFCIVTIVIYNTWIGFFPGTNLFLAWIFAFLGLTPVMLCYGMLASSMPRSGGEYVIISRILHPAMGFAAVTASFTIANWLWNASLPSIIAVNGISSTLTLVGQITGNPNLTSASASWVSSSMVTVLFFAVIFGAGIMLSLGMRTYARVQRVMFVLVILAIAVVIGTFIVTSNSTFIANFNNFMEPYMGASAYQQIIDKAAAEGLNASPDLNIGNTLIVSLLCAANGAMFTWYALPMMGEIKGASNTKLTILNLEGSLLFTTVIQLIFALVYPNAVGARFMSSVSYLSYYLAPFLGALPFPPYYLFLAGVANLSVILILIVAIGYILQQFYFVCGNILGPVRYMFAQAFDGILPRPLASVSTRFHAPLVGIGVMLAGSLGFYIISNLLPSAWMFFMVAFFVTLFVQFAVCLSGLVFPYRRKTIFNTSPIAKYKVGGIPLISICGLLGVVYCLVTGYVFVTIPALGFIPTNAEQATLSIGATIVIIAGSFIVYYFMRWYRKTKEGLDIELAFREIPPE